MEAIDRLSQQTGHAGFAGAARSGKQVGMGNTTVAQCIAQRLCDVLLAD
jgi:hypothetical protein